MKSSVLTKIVAAASVLVALSCAEKERTPVDYEIPEGHLGWLIVAYGDQRCAPLDRRDGSWVVAFSSSGEACTSTKMELGVARDRFFSVGTKRTELPLLDPGSQTGAIGGLAVMYEDGDDVKREYLYVGTAQSYRESTGDQGLPPPAILARELASEPR